jgi:hypothetical protein
MNISIHTTTDPEPDRKKTASNPAPTIPAKDQKHNQKNQKHIYQRSLRNANNLPTPSQPTAASQRIGGVWGGDVLPTEDCPPRQSNAQQKQFARNNTATQEDYAE